MRRYISARERLRRKAKSRSRRTALRQRKDRRDGRGGGGGGRRTLCRYKGSIVAWKAPPIQTGLGPHSAVRPVHRGRTVADLCASRDTDSDAEITADFAHRATHLEGHGGAGEERPAATRTAISFRLWLAAFNEPDDTRINYRLLLVFEDISRRSREDSSSSSSSTSRRSLPRSPYFAVCIAKCHRRFSTSSSACVSCLSCIRTRAGMPWRQMNGCERENVSPCELRLTIYVFNDKVRHAFKWYSWRKFWDDL